MSQGTYISYSPESSGGGGAVDSVFGRTGAVVATNGDYTASNITNVPAGDISAVTVQNALNELDTEKQKTFMYVFDSTVTAAQVNAAIDAAHAAGGGILFFKPGTYSIDATWGPSVEGVNNITIQGAGKATVFKPIDGVTWTNVAVLNFIGSAVGLTIPFNNTTANSTTITATTASAVSTFQENDIICIQGTDLDGLQDADVVIVQSADAGTGIVTLKNRISKTMTSCNVSDISRRGINNTFKDFTLDMSLMTNVGSHWGLYINNTYANRVENVTFKNAVTNGHTFLRMNTSPYSVVEKCEFTNSISSFIGASVCIGNTFRENLFDTISTDAVFGLGYVPTDMLVEGNMFRNCSDDGFKMPNINGSGKRMKIINNSFQNIVGFGVNLVGGAGHVVQGNVFHGIGNGAASVLLNGAQSCTVKGNTMENGGLMGVWLSGANCKNNVVNGNAFHQQTNRITNGAQAAAIYCDNAVNNDLRHNSYDNTASNKYATANSAAGNLYDDVIRTINANASTQDQDTIIHVDTSGGAIAVDIRTLEITSNPTKSWFIKDVTGNAAANNITITTQGAETINGAATYVINTNYGSVELYTNGTNLFTA